MIYYVSTSGDDRATGTKEAPFKTINKAASIVKAGDTVKVFGGIYREWVDPKNGGDSDNNRIVYEAVEGEHPIIKGSEIVTDWEHVEGTVWKKVLPNSMFGDWNPYFEKVKGDWLIKPTEYDVHLGEVYINGKAMYEATSKDEVFVAAQRTEGVVGHLHCDLPHPEDTVYQWFAEVDDENTTLLCNFKEYDPNKELIEINVRKCCFYPSQCGRNYITVRGFEMAHAACPFTPPTADQPGMIGSNWSKGWIIENNHLHDAKCSAVSLGKEASTGDNLHYYTMRKSGYTYQKEAVFLALRNGWSRETIGSHIVRNNVIHDCGQNGIVGHMGCAFSRIEHNHIYNIANKLEFFGYELGGIKFHAAIDTIIENNNIHDCSCYGTWLDWQAQGTRLTRNIYYNNVCDVMIEVTHGPCLFDNNLFLSKYNFRNVAQGSALVHNLCAGAVWNGRVPDRSTPYHFPHTTEVMGCAKVYSGDDRLINNLFLGMYEHHISGLKKFCSVYDKHCLPEEYIDNILADGYEKDHASYDNVPQSVMIESNAYSGLTEPYRAEKGHIIVDGMTAKLLKTDDGLNLEITVPQEVTSMNCQPVTTERLGTPRITEEPYENPDGSPIDFTVDFLKDSRNRDVIPGPFASLTHGKQTITVWKN